MRVENARSLLLQLILHLQPEGVGKKLAISPPKMPVHFQTRSATWEQDMLKHMDFGAQIPK